MKAVPLRPPSLISDSLVPAQLRFAGTSLRTSPPWGRSSAADVVTGRGRGKVRDGRGRVVADPAGEHARCAAGPGDWYRSSTSLWPLGLFRVEAMAGDTEVRSKPSTSKLGRNSTSGRCRPGPVVGFLVSGAVTTPVAVDTVVLTCKRPQQADGVERDERLPKAPRKRRFGGRSSRLLRQRARAPWRGTPAALAPSDRQRSRPDGPAR